MRALGLFSALKGMVSSFPVRPWFFPHMSMPSGIFRNFCLFTLRMIKTYFNKCFCNPLQISQWIQDFVKKTLCTLKYFLFCFIIYVGNLGRWVLQTWTAHTCPLFLVIFLNRLLGESYFTIVELWICKTLKNFKGFSTHRVTLIINTMLPGLLRYFEGVLSLEIHMLYSSWITFSFCLTDGQVLSKC